ncbi:hybrid sensor histidine kinase/response regulator [Oceanicoccus sagamiensis]|uniref:histidine kinase n=1 Tax=Oceanicoccus sagamiensis TaxID=716816 RepID=A0A1X9ND99_9GAMM|nr:HAMP domain-containing sensor histidine kinase [Oceanicoccus sagamiensis]ARN75131.1 hypothetical protein BST96_14005 [Oceanicoccus sagamiensis]
MTIADAALSLPGKVPDEKAVFNARIELIYQTFPTHTFTAVTVSLLFVFVMWSTVSPGLLISWFFVVNLFSVFRVYSWKKFNLYRLAGNDSLKPWAWLSIFHTAAAGVIWGLVPIMFVDIAEDSMSQVIISFFFPTFVMIGQAVTYSSFKPMWYAYAIPANGLMIGHLILDQNPDTNMWALALILVTAFCIAALERNYNAIMKAIHLKLQYADLMNSVKAAKEKADQANHSKSIFLASASHDLRQPVHAMNLFIEMLQKKTMPDNARQLVDRIATCARSLQSLFNSLLDISNLDAGTIEYQPKPVRAASYINALVALHRPEAEEQKLQLEADVDDIVLQTDPVLLTRILSNLIANAINHSGSGVIRLSTRQEQQAASISVEDTGRGIPPEELEHIFDEFKQLHNPERDRNKGLGLGLSICARLAKLMGTEIQVESTLNQGSRFFFSLPIADSSQTLSPVEASGSALDFSQLSALVLDDEETIREAMAMLLRDWGCQQVASAGDLQQAQALLHNGFIPQLIISDYRLRNHETGVDAVMALRAQLADEVTAILVTGDTSPQSLGAIQSSQITTLHKPVDTQQLKSTIAALLG